MDRTFTQARWVDIPRAERKQPGCMIEFYRTKVVRPYEEIAAIHASRGDTFHDGPDAFHRALQEKACELGADAVIVTQDYVGRGEVMDGVAIKYGDAATARP
jgi:hypothetical protein